MLKAEMARKGFVGWYRNPARSSQDSLGVAYEEAGQVKILRPDFIFFGKQPDGSVAADIVDPHGTQFSDALPKLRGLARYAEEHPKLFRRIESVAMIGKAMRALDLTDAKVRKSVAEAADAKALFESAIAFDY